MVQSNHGWGPALAAARIVESEFHADSRDRQEERQDDQHAGELCSRWKCALGNQSAAEKMVTQSSRRGTG